jgi:hypothetical protein
MTKRNSFTRFASMLLLVLSVLGLSGAPVFSQETPKPDKVAETAKAETILTRAIELLGGSAYLNVKTVVGRGLYTTYQDGISQVPAKFVDYISYPDKERTEFTGDGVRLIQSNSGEIGWLFDGATKTISDMKGPQIDDFKRSMRTSVENVLRGWWKKENATLTYVGRREAGLARRNETVRVTYPDGFWVEYEFAAKEGLPAKVIYKTKKKNMDSGETEEVTEEDRLAKPIIINGITAPWVVDHYINGTQTSRIGYDSVEYNTVLADSLFAKPASIKGLK